MISFIKHTKDSIFLKIFLDFWSLFKSLCPSYDTDYYDEVVTKTLNCSNPKFGFMRFLCLCYGKDSRVIAHSCKSKLCLRCGRVKGEKFSHEIKNQLHPEISYRYLTFTILEQVRIIFYQNRQEKDIFNQLIQAGWSCVEDFIQEATGHELKCGGLATLHYVGMACEYKPHLHFLIMDGGIDKETGEWVTLGEFPYDIGPSGTLPAELFS